MKFRDFARSKLDRMSIPVKFTEQDVHRFGGQVVPQDDKLMTLHVPDRSLDPRKLEDEGTRAIFEMATEINQDFQHRKVTHRKASRFRELTSMALVPDDQPVPRNVGWFTEMVNEPWFVERGSLDRNADLTMTAIMVWVSAKLREVSHTSNWFVPSDALAYKLLATDLRGVLVGDLLLPFKAFYVELPEGVFSLDAGKTGWHSVRTLVVTEGLITETTAQTHTKLDIPQPKLGRRLLVEMYGGPNSQSKSPFEDVWAFQSYSVDDPMADIERAITDSLSDAEIESSLLRGRIGRGPVLNGVEIRREVLRFLLNLCVYMGSPEARVEHVHEEAIKRLTRGKKIRQLRKNIQERVRELQNDRIFAVGTNVTISPEIKDHVLSHGETGEGVKLAYRTVVRGHWRNQAHGPGRASRTRKWIEPHVRGAGLQTKVLGHTYDVE